MRLRSRQPLRDLRPLGEVFAVFEASGFVRIHSSWAVNLNRTREVRPRVGSDDWEVVMDSPVNRVLPVARGRLRDLFAALGG